MPRSPQASASLVAILLWPLLVVGLGGYRFGVADHGIHLPMLDLVLHPERWQGDLLVDAAAAHRSVFSVLQAPLAETLGHATWNMIGYALVLVGVAAAITALCRTLGLSRRATLGVLAVAAVPQSLPGGIATLDPLLLHRMAALPIELAAVVLVLRGRVASGFFAAGAATLVHAPSGVAVGFGLGFAHAVLLRLRAEPTAGVAGSGLKEAARSVLAPPLAFFAGSAALVIPWMLEGAGDSIRAVDHHWWTILATRLPHHLLPGTWGIDVWGPFAAWAGVLIVGAVVGRRSMGPELQGLIAFAVGCLAFAVAVGTVAGPVARIALGLQLEAWQATRWVVLAAGIVGAAAADRGGRAGLGVAVAVVAATLVGQADAPRRFEPRGGQGAEAEIARWAVENTDEGDLFLVPPGDFGAFRALALRPVVTTWKDGGEATFSRGVAVEWRRRVERVCACDALDKPPGIGPLRERLRAGWVAQPLDSMLQTAAEEGADWVVVERSRVPSGGVFQAGRWVVLPAPEASRHAP